jgi:pilus assembly protein CpaD
MTKQLKMTGLSGASLKATAVRILTASVLVTGLAGCGHRLEGETTSGFVATTQDASERHPIEIEKARATLALNVPGNAHGLNIYQKERIRHFIADWRNDGSGQIVVAGNNRNALLDIRDLLIERRVPVGAVQVVGYGADQPGVKLSFARYVAEGPKCGKFPTDLGKDPNNTEYENFGCAAQHNLAAMIDNPKDLVNPRDQADWTDGDRRDFIFRNWWSGKETGGEVSKINQAGKVSDVAAQ